MSKRHQLAVLPGDGIGPEVMEQAIRVLDAVSAKHDFELQYTEKPVGGAAIDAEGSALPDETLQACESADAILFGSVGGPKWENLPPDEQPERGALLPLRKHFGLYANLRPSQCYAELTHASPVKENLITGGFDVLCVRELTGGIYFGTPKGRDQHEGRTRAIDTMVYHVDEIERIAHIAFQAASKRKGKLTSIDKANVLENGLLWRETVNRIAAEYPDVTLDHLYVDNAAMQLIKQPQSFDVVLAPNLFGDILSDEMAMIAGSLGMLASASLGAPIEEPAPAAKERASARSASAPLYYGMYEPSGGSAPDIAGQGIANPIAQILSAALLLRFSLGEEQAALDIEQAVKAAIASGHRTGDIMSDGADLRLCSTAEMGNAVLQGI